MVNGCFKICTMVAHIAIIIVGTTKIKRRMYAFFIYITAQVIFYMETEKFNSMIVLLDVS